MARKTTWQARIWPRVPDAIADDLALLRFSRLRAQLPLLYFTLISVMSSALLVNNYDAGFALRYGLPLTIVAIAIARLAWWIRHSGDTIDAVAADRQIRRTNFMGFAIALLCTAWMFASWNYSDSDQRSYFPMLLGVGVLTSSFCLASVRTASVTILLVGNLPVIATMLIAGNRMDRLAATIILLASACLVRLIVDQHRLQIEMLLMRRQLHSQAMTDPLTGLANRRALAEATARILATPGANPALILIDLDHFKPVNDHHGHAAGDALLVQIARRLTRQIGPEMTVARLGGDEFAVLVPDEGAEALHGRANALLGALAAPFTIDGQQISIGASAGLARAPGDGQTLAKLLRAADAILYAAKAQRPLESPLAMATGKSRERRIAS